MQSNVDRASAFLKLISGRTRLVLLCLLRDGERSVGELAELSGVRDTAVSQQLALLRRDGIVAARRAGQTIYYSLVSEDAIATLNLLDRLFGCP
ncbi:winged helix-turn-helix transcriptional regulator [Sphingosinithalassobacter tenebrarum]|uniref:Winged helix-turn-helix transcriptional regulator n=1 Tax=Stakelama tenebrarum TaxID=2711215 RepID=A0A6G6YAI4_9SPHN|nr:winged helix-turn-helix transcriptional regulator [Sphingosinithalassobacter tenebrarum]